MLWFAICVISEKVKFMQQSNLKLKSNLMVETVNGNQEKTKKQIQCFPGDFAALIEPSLMKDTRCQGKYFTREQILEYQQTIVCLTCKKPCAGTCQQP